MSQALGRVASHLAHAVRTAFLGPQLLAFVPAIMLAGFWFGGETALLFIAIIMPALLGIVGLFTPVRAATDRHGPSDPITRLPMRNSLEAALDQGCAQEPETGLRSAAMVLEIDEFESLATQHGDKASETVLARVADRITGAMREGDLVARLEKSMFAIALAPARRADLESMIQIAGRMQSIIAEPIIVDGIRLFVTASIGFCTPRRATEKNGKFCIDAAEIALNEAQGTGNAAIRAYSAQPKRKRVVRAGLVGEVGDALESGQITPWFQPQLSTDTGEVSGVEALARWEHPERGAILPGAFLPAISAAGMTDRLSEVILYRSLSALRDWADSGLYVPNVGVNFSGDDLSDPKLCDRIKWELDRFDLAPRRLCVEVLESVIARSSNDVVARNLAQLSELGCQIDLDDFGTGHASIANIRRFSVNRIKIDRSFVTSVNIDRQQQQMLTAILEMAARLDIETLAEGVEDAGEHALLAQLGCQHVQGYHIARPMAAKAMATWLEEHNSALPAQPKLSRNTGS